jgi:hypothetical protein
LTALPGTEQLKLHLAEGCLSNYLLPASGTINQRVLQFKNPYLLPVKLVATDFVLNGEQTGHQLTSPTIKLENGGNGQNDAFINFILKINRADIPPDKYSGGIFLRIEGARDALQVPVVELTMRYGPLRALLLLLVGVFLGWFLLFMNSQGLTLSRFTRYLDKLKDGIKQNERFDRRFLLRMLEKVELQVDNGKSKPEDATAELRKIDERRNLLLNMDELESELQDPKTPAILEKIKAIRLAVRQEKDDDARRLFNELLSEIPSERRSTPEALATMPEESIALLQAQREVTGIDKIKRSEIYTFLIEWVLPTIYYLITIFILVLVGFITLYSNNLTFGAAPLTDYAGLILWGLGSDVAGRNVQNVLTSAKLTIK